MNESSPVNTAPDPADELLLGEVGRLFKLINAFCRLPLSDGESFVD